MNFQPVIDAFAVILLNQIGPVGVVALLGAVAMWYDKREQTKIFAQAIEKLGTATSDAILTANKATTDSIRENSKVLDRLTDHLLNLSRNK